jgi:hypothetical protein
MPAVDARIVYGVLPADSEILDEPDLLVQNLTTTPSRTKKAYQGGNRATQGLEYVDPLLTFAFDAIVSERTGFADQHPGTLVLELANFAGSRFGFDPADGIMVFEDPSCEQNTSDPEMLKFSVVHYPFVEA